MRSHPGAAWSLLGGLPAAPGSSVAPWPCPAHTIGARRACKPPPWQWGPKGLLIGARGASSLSPAAWGCGSVPPVTGCWGGAGDGAALRPARLKALRVQQKTPRDPSLAIGAISYSSSPSTRGLTQLTNPAAPGPDPAPGLEEKQMSRQRGNYGGCEGAPGLSSLQLGCGSRRSRLQIEIRCGQLLSLHRGLWAAAWVGFCSGSGGRMRRVSECCWGSGWLQ